MNTFTHKEGAGSLFKNEKKTAENQPDYRGEIMLKGETLVIAGWVKESKTGKKFVSLKVEAQGQLAEAKTATPEEKNDDLPF
jgi:uncharacterized protein (DUF736 family)